MYPLLLSTKAFQFFGKGACRPFKTPPTFKPGLSPLTPAPAESSIRGLGAADWEREGTGSDYPPFFIPLLYLYYYPCLFSYYTTIYYYHISNKFLNLGASRSASSYEVEQASPRPIKKWAFAFIDFFIFFKWGLKGAFLYFFFFLSSNSKGAGF